MGPRILRSEQRGPAYSLESRRMAWRVAGSRLALMASLRGVCANEWGGDSGGLEEWLRGQDSNLQPSG